MVRNKHLSFLLPYVRNECLPSLGIIGKPMAVPHMMTPSPGSQVGHGPQGKHGSGHRPGGHGKSDPFDDLAKIVGTRYPSIQSAMRDRIIRLR